MKDRKNKKKIETQNKIILKKETILPRGRVFEGIVIRKFPKRVAIEFERTLYIQKYERFLKKRTRIHARLPDNLANEVNIGDLIQIQESRPLSKIIHHLVIKKIKSSGVKK